VKKIFLLFISILYSCILFSQNQVLIDSLQKQIELTSDSDRVDIYNSICWNMRNSNPEEAVKYGLLAIELSEKLNYKIGIVKAYGFIGVSYRNLGKYSEAFDHYYKGLELSKKFGILEQEGYAYINLGNLYIYQEYFDDAIENLDQAHLIAEKIDNKKMLAYSFLNLGRAYLLKSEYDLALSNLNLALEIRLDLDEPNGQAVCYKYIADIYNELQKYDTAYSYYEKSLALTDFKDDKDLLSDIYNNIALIYLKSDNFELSERYSLKSLEVAYEVGSKLRIKNVSNTLSKLYIELKKYEKASYYQNLVICYTDTLFNQRLTEKILTLKNIAEQQKKQSEIDILNKDNEIQNLKLVKQNTFIWSLTIVLGMTLGLIFLLFFSNNQRKKANLKLEYQKNLILEKNSELNSQNEEIAAQRDEIMVQKEFVENQRDKIILQKKQITDSLHYARRIQSAIMQSKTNLEDFFTEIFIWLEPRDIVSGDFYWFHKFENKILLAVADCTGHGVPGAFMSLLGINSLKEIVINEKVSTPNLVLKRLREIIKISLNQSIEGNDPKDGMDIAFCSFDLENSILEFSGANNTIYLIRNHEFKQFEVVRNPIGIYINEKDFVNHEIILQKSDVIYLFTDGYYSQFGGEKDEKFKVNRFRELIMSIHTQNILEQKKCLTNTFNNWKGNKNQIDDILIIGIKI